ncbi:hypothetical protein Tco_0761502 [Tanacetum coccineum]
MSGINTFWQKSVVISRQGSRSLARLRDEMRQASDTQEYPSLIDTFWRTHTVDGVFPKDEDRRIYEEMKRLEATGEYTEDEINRLARGGKLRGHIPGVGRVLPSRATSRPSMPAPDKSLKSIHKKVDFMMSLFRSDSKYSDMFKEFESGGASGSGGCGDDEESGDDEEGEDEDGDGERLHLKKYRLIPGDKSLGILPQQTKSHNALWLNVEKSRIMALERTEFSARTVASVVALGNSGI